jgi:hypothetical protein
LFRLPSFNSRDTSSRVAAEPPERAALGAGPSREAAKRSELAGWSEYGYCASHSRYFWGLRLHLVATLGGLPIAFARTGARAEERQTLLGILTDDPALAAVQQAIARVEQIKVQ